MNQPAVLIIPGLHGSGPRHWQSEWERRDPRRCRVLQRSWDEPRRAAWTEALDRQLAACAEPAVLVAHSLGCAAVAHLPRRATARVRAALLVAPCDVDFAERLLPSVRDFAPLPLERLPFASVVVASTNDPYLELRRARRLAATWGSKLVVLPDAGHINVEAGFGPWPEGELLLETLIEQSMPATLETRLRA
jgi:predicted alpha/beta hydrolase family esterase